MTSRIARGDLRLTWNPNHGRGLGESGPSEGGVRRGNGDRYRGKDIHCPGCSCREDDQPPSPLEETRPLTRQYCDREGQGRQRAATAPGDRGSGGDVEIRSI